MVFEKAFGGIYFEFNQNIKNTCPQIISTSLSEGTRTAKVIRYAEQNTMRWKNSVDQKAGENGRTMFWVGILLLA